MKRNRQMRNSFGVLIIFFKGRWMLFLFILLLLGLAIYMTWAALFRWGWAAWIYAILLWLGGGFFAWGVSEDVWDVLRDAFGRRTTTLKGNVGRKWINELEEYQIALNHRSFEVSKEIYNWLAKGDTVVVHYWPRSKIVAKIEKVSVQDFPTPSLVRERAALEPPVTRSYEEHLDLGREHSLVGELAEAEAELRAALKLRPNSAEALGNLGSVYLELEEYDEGVDHLLRAIDIEPNNEDFLVQLAYAYPDSRSFTDDVQKIRSLIEQVDKRSEAYELLHLVYWLGCVKRGETSRAIDSMQQYVSDPQTKRKRYVRKLLAALKKGTDNFMDAWKME